VEYNLLIAEVEKTMNTCAFGMEDPPSMWYFSRSLSEGEGQLYAMGDIHLPTTKVCKVMSCLKMIIGVCVEGRTRRNMIWDCLSHYRFAMHGVTCPKQYTALELVSFKEDSHHFIILWVLLYGVQGCTDYTHVLMTHLIKYMMSF
jgi:hypothetical protein